ncbi:MAG: precorrin-6A reductase [Halanaerobiales bacterium]
MILVLGGTREGREIVELLLKKGKKVIASVTSSYGKRLLAEYEIKINQQKLNQQELSDFIKENGIDLIIDATHPFARKISENAIKAARNNGIKYIRFERKKIKINNKYNHLVHRVSDYRKAAEKAGKYRKIFLTIGSNNLSFFTRNIENWEQKLIVRILPVAKYLKKLEKIGFSPANIIAIQGPFSQEFNEILIKDNKIEVLVTKASGSKGGLDTKLKAAFFQSIPVILIERPQLDYDRVVSNYQKLLQKI